jgi:hypothetical protein
MSREREELLALVRHADDPSQADEERVLRALQAAVAAGGRASQGKAVRGRAEASGKLAARPGAVALKLGVGTVLVAVASMLVWRALPAPESASRGETTTQLAKSELRAPVEGEAAPSPDAAQTAGRMRQRWPGPRAPAPRSGQPAPRHEPRLPEEERGRAQRERAGQAASGRTSEPATQAAARRAQSTASSLRPEIALLERVQAALRDGDGATALRELDAHRTADRMFLAERQAARILALCMLERVAEARSAAQRFAAQHPESPQRAAIEGSCANPRRIGPP